MGCKFVINQNLITMKKILTLLFIATISMLLTACSDDSSDQANPSGDPSTYDPQGTVTLNINGETKVYNQIDMVTFDEVESDGSLAGRWLVFSASINGSSSEYVTFRIYQGRTGTGHLLNFAMTTNSVEYNSFEGSSNTLINSDRKLKVNFSGLLYMGYDDDNNLIVHPITESIIDIAY